MDIIKILKEDRGVPDEAFGSHQSDLYVRGDLVSIHDLRKAAAIADVPLGNMRKLTGAKDTAWAGKMFYEIPFGHLPYWAARQHPPGYKMKKQGILIALEGIDGCGKSSQAKRLHELLAAIHPGRRVVVSAEPTREGPHGARLRRIMSGAEPSVSRDEELELFVRDREWHYREMFGPVLDSNGIVILDRYYGSTMAYQSRDEKWSPEHLESLSREVAPAPDVFIILDVRPAVALQRIGARAAEKGGESPTSYEQLGTLTHCRDVFLSMAGRGDCHVVSAEAAPQTVHRRIVKILRQTGLLKLPE